MRLRLTIPVERGTRTHAALFGALALGAVVAEMCARVAATPDPVPVTTGASAPALPAQPPLGRGFARLAMPGVVAVVQIPPRSTGTGGGGWIVGAPGDAYPLEADRLAGASGGSVAFPSDGTVSSPFDGIVGTSVRISIVDATGDDLPKEATLVSDASGARTTGYVRPGGRVEMTLPTGSYSATISSGGTWHGPDRGFAPDAANRFVGRLALVRPYGRYALALPPAG